MGYAEEARSWGFDLSAPDPQQLGSLLQRQKQFEWQQHIGDVKMVLGLYERAFSSPNLSDASRENLSALASTFAGSLTGLEQRALQGTLMLRFLSPEEQRLREYERRFPAPKPPKKPDGELMEQTPENALLWGQFALEKAEWAQKRAITAYGVEKGKALSPVPALVRTSAENVYAFRDPMTRNVQLVHLDKDLPKGLLKRALDENLTSLSEVARYGGFPVNKPVEGSYGGYRFATQEWYDVRTGRRGLRTKPIGATKEMPEAPPAWVLNASYALKIGDEDTAEKLLKDPRSRGLYEELRKVLEMSYGSKEQKVALAALQNELRAAGKNGVNWIPVLTGTPERSWLHKASGGALGKIELEGGGVSFVRTGGVKQFIDATGAESINLYYDPISGNHFDARGKLVPEAKGKESGEQLPTVKVAKPQRAEELRELGEANGIKVAVKANRPLVFVNGKWREPKSPEEKLAVREVAANLVPGFKPPVGIKKVEPKTLMP